LTEVLPPLEEGTPPAGDRPPGRSTSTARRAAVAVLGLLVTLTLGVAVVMLHPGGGGPAAQPSGTPSAAPTPSTGNPTTSASPSASPTSTPPSTAAPSAAPSAPPDAVTAVWPASSSDVRYAGPVAAARGFAVDLVGFRRPVLGSYRAGDGRSGEVEVRPEAGGPVTTVFVRRMSDDTWWVLGSATDGIELDTPPAGDVVTSPVVLTGRAWAFEGHVSVRIVEDGSRAPLATGFVTGGGDELRPFTGSFRLRTAQAAHGAVVLTTDSARDGQVWTAAVVRVGLARA
jgi:hypothetical protein